MSTKDSYNTDYSERSTEELRQELARERTRSYESSMSGDSVDYTYSRNAISEIERELARRS